MERDFKGIWIPKEIWLCKELSALEKLFIVEIDSLDNENGCFASNDYFSDFFDLSKNRCSEIIKNLEKKGFLSVAYQYRQGTKSIEKRIIKVIGLSTVGIRKTDRGIRKTDRGIRKIDLGYSEKGEDNNTLLNNIINKETTPISERFNEFWKSYPKRVGKGEAEKAFKKIKPSQTLMDTILKAISDQKGSEQWNKEDGQYIPNPATWLNQKRWEDELKMDKPSKPVHTPTFDIDEYEKSSVFDVFER